MQYVKSILGSLAVLVVLGLGLFVALPEPLRLYFDIYSALLVPVLVVFLVGAVVSILSPRRRRR